MDSSDRPLTGEGRPAGLPQLQDRLFLTDSGLETTLIYRHHLDLPEFAAFVLLETKAGRERLRAYFECHAAIARGHGAGFIAESATWRANPDWGALLGYDADRLAAMNRTAVLELAALRTRLGQTADTFVISGCLGPRHDGYDPGMRMGAPEAERYHEAQIQTFADTPVDLVSVLTITYVDEAVGITRAAGRAGLPVVVSFTVETDGRLPSGTTIQDAILQVDAATGRGPAYYMINCAHPTHFGPALHAGGTWPLRLRGIRANASRRSHAELDAATTLDDGDPVELAVEYRRLVTALPQLTILGGCCGTDHRHVAAIAEVCADLFEPVRAARQT
ncbi:MAG TPA: homocysteine S-methyltransferase family protein [Solirubrobacteraceae bacterium]|nr:homocysteine S-methyltransferase family protein [Solirubrobacteraceae bacterium]